MLILLFKKVYIQYFIVNVNWFWMFINVCLMGMFYMLVIFEFLELEEEIKFKKRLQVYLDLCFYLGIIFVIYFSRQMFNKGIVMWNYSIGFIGVWVFVIVLLVSQ